MNFEGISCSEGVKQSLSRAFAESRLPHAMILEGPAGSGKAGLARWIAKAAVCTGEGERPCGRCSGCMKAAAGAHPDITIAGGGTAARSFHVDTVRQIRSDAYIKPNEAPLRVFLLEGAEAMSEQAQNALLKTIEEPPAYAVILLLTANTGMLLPTILSRCVVLDLKPVPSEKIKKYLMEELELPDYKADVCTAFAQGNVGKAKRLALSDSFSEMMEHAIHLVKYISEMDVSDLTEDLKKIGTYKIDINDYLDLLMVWYRDVLMFKATQDADLLIFKEELGAIRDKAKNSSYEGLECILKALDKAKIRLNANVNFDMVMELLLLTMKEN